MSYRRENDLHSQEGNRVYYPDASCGGAEDSAPERRQETENWQWSDLSVSLRLRDPSMPMKKLTRIGIITAGGDSPGLNAAIRGVGKAALDSGMEFVGFRDGFRGLAEDLLMRLDKRGLSGIMTIGGTVVGTGRDKPHRKELN